MRECYENGKRKKQLEKAARDAESDEPMDSTCIEMVNVRTERELAAVYAQPRDADWAVPMEQRLRWHLRKRLAS